MDIKICDAIMGAGKTSAAINYMNDSPGKFIFITPYLKECDRIIDNCPIKNFKSPKDILESWIRRCLSSKKNAKDFSIKEQRSTR